MKIRDIFELAQMNFKRRFKSNIGLIVIFTIVIVVFNITYTLTSAIKQNTSLNITENKNLKIINVSTVEEEITAEEMNYITEIPYVGMAVYNYCLSIAIEDNSGTEVDAIGMNDIQASYLVGKNVSLGDDEIILNTTFEENGYQIGDTIEVSYNVRVSNSAGIRESKKFTIVSFYEQPVIDTWYKNVMIVSQNNIFTMASGLYGLSVEDIKNGNLYKQSLLVFVDDVDKVMTVAKAIDNKGLITSYALAYSQELPTFAKAVIGVGAAIIIVLLIMGIIVMNATLNNNIRSRYKEIGILKSIGMRETNIFSILSAEVFLLWADISILATIISIAVTKLLPNYLNLSEMGEFHISVIQVVLSVIVSYIIMFLTTAFTIKKASELKIIEVLRNE